MKRFTSLILISLFAINLNSQNIVKGVVVDEDGQQLNRASVSLKNTNFRTTTNEKGFFELSKIPNGEQLLVVEKQGYEIYKNQITLVGKDLIIDEIVLYKVEDENLGEIVINEDELDDDTDVSDNISGLLHSSKDTYLRTAAFEWSSSFYRVRGLDSDNSKVLINGIEMNKLHTGRPQWGNWGGANDLTRYKETSNGLSPIAHHFGGALGVTNMSTRASKYREGGSISYASSNRSYRNRLMASYKSGMLETGWAFAVLMSRRAGNEGFQEGTLYNSNTIMASVEKKLNDQHSIGFTSIYAQNKRGKSAFVTQEVFDIKGLRYNPNWGYQGDKKRNARIKRIEEPILMLNHYWKPNSKWNVNTAIAYQFGETANSRINYNGARLLASGSVVGGGSNPDPSYYRNLPSYAIRNGTNNVYDLLKKFQSDGQIDWANLYAENMTGDHSKYVLYEDATDDKQLNVSSTISFIYNDNITFNSRLSYTNLESENFAKVLDLLGGNYYLDVDSYASTFEEQQNDLQHPNRKVHEGDKFGYHYLFHSTLMNAFVQGVFNYNKVDFYLAGDFSRTTHQREGLFQKGTFKNNSLGLSPELHFVNLSAKAGLTYKITGRHLLDFNGAFINKAPNLRNTFANSRQNNNVTKGLESEKLLSLDASYVLRTPKVQARLTGFYITNKDKTNNTFFYADGLGGDGADFVQETTSGISTQHIGVEFGIEAQVSSRLKLKAASNFGQYTYNDDAFVSLSSDDPNFSFKTQKAYLKNYKVAAGPQKTYSLGFDYRDPEFWWLSINGSYFDDVYVGISNIKRTDNFKKDTNDQDFLDYDEVKAKELLRQEKFDPYFILNVVGGKSWRIKNGKYIGFFISLNNVLNTEYKIAGFEQARTTNYKKLKEDQSLETPVFANKYLFGRGATYFANIYYRF